MKRIIALLFLIGLSLGIAFGQTTTVTATITDSDSQAWVNGTWFMNLISPNGPPYIAGNPVTANFYKGSLDGSGTFVQTVATTSLISPSGAYWQVTLCSETIAPCSSNVILTTSGSSQNSSSALSSQVTAPRFAANPTAYGYADGEVTPVPKPGGQYFNVITPALRIWNGAAWTTPSGGGGGATFAFPGINYATSNAAARVATITDIQAQGGLGVHVNAYVHYSPLTCMTVTWPHSGCVDDTVALQAAFTAASLISGYVVFDSPPAGMDLFVAGNLNAGIGEGGMIGLGRQFANETGAAVYLIPGTNASMFNFSSSCSSGYLNYYQIDNMAFYGDLTFASTSGSALVFGCHIAERTVLHNVTANNWPQDCIQVNHGSDPLWWQNVEASGCGYDGHGPGGVAYGVHLTKGGGDPWDMVSIDGLSLDNDWTAGLGVDLAGSGSTVSDTMRFSNIKTESRSANPHQRGTPVAIQLNNLNATPVEINGLSTVNISGFVGLTTVSRNGSGTVTATFSGAYPPQVGQLVAIGSVTPSDLNGNFTIVTSAAGTVTWAQGGSTETASVPGQMQWNQQDVAAIETTGTGPLIHMTAASIGGGTNGFGPYGYPLLIDEVSTGFTFSTTSLPYYDGIVGHLADLNYLEGSFVVSVDNQAFTNNGGNTVYQVKIPGNTYPLFAISPYGIRYGIGSTPVDSLLGRGPDIGSFSCETISGGYASGNCYMKNMGLLAGTAIASAATITPISSIFHITGTSTINTINVPVTSSFGTTLDVIADAAWATGTSGNISNIVTAVAGNVYHMVWDGTKWTVLQSSGGGSGSPGGTNTQIQYNCSGSFCGAGTMDSSGNAGLNSIVLTDNTVNTYFDFGPPSGGNTLPSTPATNHIRRTINSGVPCNLYPDGVCYNESKLAIWEIQPGTGDGVDVASAATYPSVNLNSTGKTITITAISCNMDGGASTVDIKNNAGTSFLTGPITCGTGNTWTAGTQSATVTLAAGDAIHGVYVMDGTTKTVTVDVRGTYSW